LLGIPADKRQTLVVVGDPVLEELERHASAQQAEPVEVDSQPEQLARLIGVLTATGASRGGRSVVGRAQALVRAGARRAAGAPPAVMPTLAVGVLGIGAAAVLLRGRDAIPVDVTFVSASAARGLTFSGGSFEIGGVYSAHPKHDDLYLPWVGYSRSILQERVLEAAAFFIGCCGASTVETLVEEGDDLAIDARVADLPGAGSAKWNAKVDKSSKQHRVIKAPGRKAPTELVRDDWTWIDDEPEWQKVHDLRLRSQITSYELRTDINDHRVAEGKALSKLPGAALDLNAAAKRHAKTVVKWKVSFPPAK
jgi:hypothetical protein